MGVWHSLAMNLQHLPTRHRWEVSMSCVLCVHSLDQYAGSWWVGMLTEESGFSLPFAVWGLRQGIHDAEAKKMEQGNEVIVQPESKDER